MGYTNSQLSSPIGPQLCCMDSNLVQGSSLMWLGLYIEKGVRSPNQA